MKRSMVATALQALKSVTALKTLERERSVVALGLQV
jgi:hypothetical protein